MKNYLPLSLLLLIACLLPRSGFSADSTFDQWTGSWKGSCKLTPPYNGTESFDASLTIGKDEGTKGVQWQLIYEASGSLPKQVRDYVMLPVDASKGHYAIDENNGLLLDSFVNEDVIYSPFRINGKLITATYIRIDENKMMVDMPSFDANPIRKTCVTGNPKLCSESFGLRMTQRCTLERDVSKNSNKNKGE